MRDREVHRNVEIVIYAAIGIISLISNLLIIIVISTSKKFRTRSTVLLINLALTDLLIIITGIPVTIHNLHSKNRITSGAACDALGFLIFTAFIGSNINLTLIAVHRYFLITNKKLYEYLFSKKRLVVAVFASWWFTLLLCCPPLFGWGTFEYNYGRAHCMFKWDSSLVYLVLVQVLSFSFPLCLMIFCYYKIIQTSSKSRKRIESSVDKSNLHKKLKEQKLTMMLIVVVATFFTCFIPYAVLIYGEGFFAWQTPVKYSFIAMVFAYSNSMFDFWIYSVMSQKFRMAFKHMFRKFSRKRRFQVRPQREVPLTVSTESDHNVKS